MALSRLLLQFFFNFGPKPPAFHVKLVLHDFLPPGSSVELKGNL